MTSFDSDFGDDAARSTRIARLAALQRLRDQAAANDQKKMLETINQMIESELRGLSQLDRTGNRDPEPA